MFLLIFLEYVRRESVQVQTWNFRRSLMFGCFREPLECGAWLVRDLLPLPMLPVLDGLRRGLQPYHSDCFFSDSKRQLSTEILSGNFKKTKMCSRAVFRCFRWMERMGDKVTGAAGPVFVTLAIVLISSGVFCFCESSKVVVEVSNDAD